MLFKILKILLGVFLLAAAFLFYCQKTSGTYLGIFQDREKIPPWTTDRLTIPPERAYELAQPYLEESFRLRQEMRTWNSDRPPNDHFTLKGGQYHIARDNYPYIFTGSYLKHAVIVDANTGAITPPK